MAISPEAAESFRQRRNLKRVLIIVVIGIILSVYWDNNNQYVPSNDSSTTPTIENSWSIPAGYTAWDGNVAYKYVDNPNCTYSDSICVAINVVTQKGCPRNLYGEISLLDKSGVQYSYTNDTISSLSVGTVGELTFDILDYERFSSFNLSKISCY